jgi:MFS family permease
MNLGATLASPIVGALARLSWRHPFLFDAIAFIPVIFMLLFLKEPAIATATTNEETRGTTPSEKGRFTWRTYYYIAMQLLTTAVLFPLLSGLSTFMADKRIGTAVLVGTILSTYNLSGMAVNVFLSPMMKLFKQYIIGVMCILVTIGTTLVLFVTSIPIIFLGVILAGCGFNAMISVFQIYNGRTLPASTVALGSTTILAMLQLGIFASTYFITGCHAIFNRGTDVESAYVGCLILYALMAVIAFVINVAPAEDYNK